MEGWSRRLCLLFTVDYYLWDSVCTLQFCFVFLSHRFYCGTGRNGWLETVEQKGEERRRCMTEVLCLEQRKRECVDRWFESNSGRWSVVAHVFLGIYMGHAKSFFAHFEGKCYRPSLSLFFQSSVPLHECTSSFDRTSQRNSSGNHLRSAQQWLHRARRAFHRRLETESHGVDTWASGTGRSHTGSGLVSTEDWGRIQRGYRAEIRWWPKLDAAWHCRHEG